jgi:hypothetical protein
MPVYSVPLPESSVLKALEHTEKVRIIGCGFCDNWSLAYNNKQPINEIKTEGDKTITVRYALSLELNRWKKQLEKEGKSCETEIVPQLCVYTEDPTIIERSYLHKLSGKDFVDRCKGSDAVLCLGCSAAFAGLKRRLGDDVMVIPAWKSVGAIQIQTYMDETGKFEMMNNEGSIIINHQ